MSRNTFCGRCRFYVPDDPHSKESRTGRCIHVQSIYRPRVASRPRKETEYTTGPTWYSNNHPKCQCYEAKGRAR